jgi:hypothetical protein
MAITKQDKQLVRMLLLKHLPSGFPQELGALTIGAVACHVYNEWQMRRTPLFVWEKPLIDRLLPDETPLPADLSDATVGAALAEAMQSAPTLSFIGLFREAIDALILARGGRR